MTGASVISGIDVSHLLPTRVRVIMGQGTERLQDPQDMTNRAKPVFET